MHWEELEDIFERGWRLVVLEEAKFRFSRVSFVRVSCWKRGPIVSERRLALETTPDVHKEGHRPMAKTFGDRLKYYGLEFLSFLPKRKFIYRTVRSYR